MQGFSTCCCCLSLRMGALILSGLMITFGIFGILVAGDFGIIGAIFNAGAGAVGFYAAWTRNAQWLRIFFYLLLATMLVQVLAGITFLLLHEWAIQRNVTAACADQPDEAQMARCEDEVRKFAGTHLLLMWATNTLFNLLINSWFLMIVHSFLRVVEAGGTGDEKRTPEDIEGKSSGNPTEGTPLQPVEEGLAGDAFLLGEDPPRAQPTS